MNQQEGACLVCGKPIIYLDQAKQMACSDCHQLFSSNACCEDGHYVCDACHGKRGIAFSTESCQQSGSKNPILLLQQLMRNPWIHMHGPEHHVLVGSTLLTAYHNCGGKLDLPDALKKMADRGSKVPGGICGFWGCCGAAVSTGIYVSILTKSTPLANADWGLSNLMTSASLQAIGQLGGPRCCKRDSFIAVQAAADFTRQNFGVTLELPETVHCGFFHQNQQCLQEKCPYHPNFDGAQPLLHTIIEK